MIKIINKTKKTCHQCKHLEWIDGDDYYNTGYTCSKRQDEAYIKGVEHILLRNLDSEKYRNRHKRCFESRKGGNLNIKNSLRKAKMIEQSDIVEIYSDDEIQSVTIRMPKRDAEILCNSMGLSSVIDGEFIDKDGRFVASVYGGNVEFYSR